MLLFFLGMLAGLSWMIPFALGLKARKNLEMTGSIIGHIKKQAPVMRDDKDEYELEERLNAER